MGAGPRGHRRWTGDPPTADTALATRSREPHGQEPWGQVTDNSSRRTERKRQLVILRRRATGGAWAATAGACSVPASPSAATARPQGPLSSVAGWRGAPSSSAIVGSQQMTPNAEHRGRAREHTADKGQRPPPRTSGGQGCGHTRPRPQAPSSKVFKGVTIGRPPKRGMKGRAQPSAATPFLGESGHRSAFLSPSSEAVAASCHRPCVDGGLSCSPRPPHQRTIVLLMAFDFINTCVQRTSSTDRMCAPGWPVCTRVPTWGRGTVTRDQFSALGGCLR